MSEEQLRGHWSNGDPVHVIMHGDRPSTVAPNLNGATWIPTQFTPPTREEIAEIRARIEAHEAAQLSADKRTDD